jgi:hypothetical protein
VERHPQLDIAQDGAALHRRQQHQVASIQAEGYRKLYLTFGPPQSTAPSGMDFDAPARYIDACDIAIGRKCPMAASHAGSTLLAHPTCSSGSLRGFALASRSGSIPSKPRSFDPRCTGTRRTASDCQQALLIPGIGPPRLSSCLYPAVTDNPLWDSMYLKSLILDVEKRIVHNELGLF